MLQASANCGVANTRSAASQGQRAEPLALVGRRSPAQSKRGAEADLAEAEAHERWCPLWKTSCRMVGARASAMRREARSLGQGVNDNAWSFFRAAP